MNDFEIVKKLKTAKTDKDYNSVVRVLHKQHKPTIMKMATNYIGDKLDAEEVYNDSVLLFLDIVRKDEYSPELSAIGTFIYSIARFKCLKKKEANDRRNNRETNAYDNSTEEVPLTPEQITIAEERLDYLSKLLDKLCEKCRLIIEAYHLNEQTWKVVAKMFEYETEEAVKMKGRRCLLKLRKFVSY